MYVTDIAIKLSNNFAGPFSTTLEYIVGGYHTPGDGGGGIFVWIDASITNSDGGITVNNPNTSGYFKRIYSGPINVRWFGAKGDGVTDDTAAVHAARDSKAFANNGTIYFPVGEYCGFFDFTYAYPNRNEFNIIGDGQGT